MSDEISCPECGSSNIECTDEVVRNHRCLDCGYYMPPVRRAFAPFVFVWGEAGPTLESAVYQALGAVFGAGRSSLDFADVDTVGTALIAFTRTEAAATLSTADLCAELLARAPIGGVPPATTNLEIIE